MFGSTYDHSGRKKKGCGLMMNNLKLDGNLAAPRPGSRPATCQTKLPPPPPEPILAHSAAIIFCLTAPQLVQRYSPWQLRRSNSFACQTKSWCATPTCNSQASAHSQLRAAADARGPHVTCHDGYVAGGELIALPSHRNYLILRLLC